MRCFWHFPKYWKPVIDGDRTLLKLQICHLQGVWKANIVNNSPKWSPFHSKWHHIDGGSSGDHFWHFWNFAQFLCFSDFFGNFQKPLVFWSLKSIWSADWSGNFNIKVYDATKRYYARKNGPTIPWNIFRAELLTPKTVEVRASQRRYRLCIPGGLAPPTYPGIYLL